MSQYQRVDDTELREKGLKALCEALGPLEAVRFVALLHKQPGDSVEMSRMLYEGQTVDEILERAKRNWKG